MSVSALGSHTTLMYSYPQQKRPSTPTTFFVAPVRCTSRTSRQALHCAGVV